MRKKHKLLTLEQLAKFCEENKFYSFNSQNSGYTLSVQVPGELYFESDTTQGLLFATVKVCHTELNRNGSYISEDNMKKAMPSLKYRPFLAYIHQLDSGEYDFHGHDMEIVVDENGEEQIVYKESQVGTFTADDPYLEYDKDMDKTYVIAEVAIPEEYTLAADIIRRKEGTKVSAELCIDTMSYNAKEKYLELEDFYFSGCTGLGSEKDGTQIGEGMVGSRLDIKDFSTENNSICSHYNNMNDRKLIETLEKLDSTLSSLSNFNINNSNAEGKEDKQVNKFEELLEKYNKTKEDITFEYEGLSDEELEAAFSKAFTEENEESEGEEKHEDNEGSDGEDDPEVKENEACGGSTKKKKKKKCSITEEDGTVREFELSLNDVQSALYNLVNDTYSESDNTWYGVTVYDSYVIMCDWWNDKNYKQTYKREDDNFSLIGDRVEVFANWLTKDEEDSLAELRSNYSEVKSQLETYQKAEEAEKKDALFISNDYKAISEKEDFIELSKNHEEFSLEELNAKLDAMLLSCAKSGNINFSEISKEEKKNKATNKVGLPFNTTQKKRRYGSLFSK